MPDALISYPGSIEKLKLLGVTYLLLGKKLEELHFVLAKNWRVFAQSTCCIAWASHL